jgi:hypothetical protein
MIPCSAFIPQQEVWSFDQTPRSTLTSPFSVHGMHAHCGQISPLSTLLHGVVALQGIMFSHPVLVEKATHG